MTRWADQPLPKRQLADRLYDPLQDERRLWVGPCGHSASSMWVRDDLVVVCAAVLSSTHVASAAHFVGACGQDCTVIKCGATYTADDLPAPRVPE